MAIYYTNSAEETHSLAIKIGRKLKSGDVIAYRGGMGAGKTTFTRGLVEGIGIDAHVSSPTFALVNEYIGNGKSLYHFDMYRIQSFEDLLSTGFFDYLDSGEIIVVEWSEKIQQDLPENAITITLEVDQNQPEGRKITIEGGSF